VPFSGSSPLAIAIKHSTDLPRPPREIVMSIPEDLEWLVLRTLEKLPEDRPANASEFRSELLTIAERLGLEHAAITEVPDIEALRNVGVESPSGRLVIDIAKLRESRAFSSNTSEETIIRPGALAGQSARKENGSYRQQFPRVNVPVQRKSASRFLILAAAIIAALFIGGYLALKLRAPEQRTVVITPTPLPTATPTVAPSASPAATRTATPTPTASPSPSPEKKRGKVGSFVNKVKRILKKPF
ncbi:MAG TPA: hypothetical protein VF251_10040, partial [Pyrinomonadaceae bacterium]